MKWLKAAMFLVLGISLVGCQVKPEQETLVRLGTEEVEQLFVGKTVESYNLISGSTSFTYYEKTGGLHQERYWTPRKGQWKINSDGQICLSLQGKTFKCRHIYRKGNRYYKYRLDEAGELEKVIRYRQFLDGRQI